MNEGLEQKKRITPEEFRAGVFTVTDEERKKMSPAQLQEAEKKAKEATARLRADDAANTITLLEKMANDAETRRLAQDKETTQ